ncbi:ATP-grasp domain-containing protein [Oceanobacillus iheyensis]|uniref:ATP-grasp domain-containing protein n=1 Tax=Oceanobacillus iheyensis TaxID=182710 RepID=UPI003634A5D6
MNLLVTSVGRRVKLIEYLKSTLNKIDGKVVATDCDLKAPGLYFADKYEIVPRIDDTNYITHLLKICEKHNIDGIFSLIDPELEVLAINKDKFDQKSIKLILSPLDMIEKSFDKQKTFNFLTDLSIPVVPTVDDYEEAISLINNKKFKFPIVVKPRKGSASNGIYIVNNTSELKNAFTNSVEMVIQPFYKDKEFGIDVYIDMESGVLVDMFIKEKVVMRSGETDKSISIHNEKIEQLVSDFVLKTDYSGPIDIDCFEKNGEYYISEINPRFGGGYPHAYEMGCNFMSYIVKNINNEKNPKYDGLKYKSNYVMMKYDNVKIVKG